jgi:hypothetical protein
LHPAQAVAAPPRAEDLLDPRPDPVDRCVAREKPRRRRVARARPNNRLTETGTLKRVMKAFGWQLQTGMPARISLLSLNAPCAGVGWCATCNACSSDDRASEAAMKLRIFLACLSLAAVAACEGKLDREAHRLAAARMTDAGLLRLERTPADAPFHNADLARNFERIALRSEVELDRPGTDDNAREGTLRRWSGPIRWSMVGAGATWVDRAEIADVFDLIAQASGLEIAEAGRGEAANFIILITTQEERDHVAALLERVSRPVARVFDQWRRSPLIVCAGVFGGPRPEIPDISVAFLFLGDELTGRLRRACIHEEITQAMGLPNDHPDVRPSIFNDDQEFALLTVHDEWLLRLLYDPRLEPGMEAATVRPILQGILAERRP